MCGFNMVSLCSLCANDLLVRLTCTFSHKAECCLGCLYYCLPLLLLLVERELGSVAYYVYKSIVIRFAHVINNEGHLK